MIVRPGDVLGLPDPAAYVAAFRWVLVLLAATAAAAFARGKPRLAVVFAVLFCVCAVGFWVLALGRPYGVFADPHHTARAADLAVAAESGRADERFLSGEPRSPDLSGRAAARFPRGLLFLGPTWLPIFVLPLTALLLARLAGNDALPAALLWMAFSTGDLDTARGAGFVPGLWARPGAALAFMLVLGALALGRARIHTRRAAVVAGLAVAAAWLALGFRSAPIGQVGALLLLTLDQGLWLWLAAWGLWRAIAPAALALMTAGGLLALIGTDGWGAHAFYRAGVLLAAIPAVREAARRLGTWLHSARPKWTTLEPTALGGGVLLALGMMGSTLAWWDPPRWDPLAGESLDEMSAAVLEPMAWLREQTPRDAVVLASATYAPAVAVIAGRRVLRAPTLLKARDDDRRSRLEHLVLTAARSPSPEMLARYGLRYVLAAPGDFQDRGVRAPHELAERAHLKLRHVSGEGFRVYEIVGGPGSGGPGRAAAP